MWDWYVVQWQQFDCGECEICDCLQCDYCCYVFESFVVEQLVQIVVDVGVDGCDQEFCYDQGVVECLVDFELGEVCFLLVWICCGDYGEQCVDYEEFEQECCEVGGFQFDVCFEGEVFFDGGGYVGQDFVVDCCELEFFEFGCQNFCGEQYIYCGDCVECDGYCVG